MANPQLVAGGPAVEFSMTAAVSPNSPGNGNYGVLAPGYIYSTPFNPTGVIPASGASVTVGHFTIGNTGRTQTASGATFPILTLQADVTTPPGMNYDFEQGLSSGHVGSLFDVVAPVSAKTINAAHQFFGTLPATARIRATVQAAHAPVLTLAHSSDFTTRTAITPPTPTQDNTVTPPAWHYDLTLPAPVTDTFFHLTAASAAGTSDAVTLTDFRLFDGAGNTPAPDTTPPAVPSGLAAQVASTTSITVTFTRNTESDLAGYLFLRNGARFTPTLTATANTVSFTDAALTTGNSYAYRVAAYDASGNQSAYCAAATATPSGTPPVAGGTGTALADDGMGPNPVLTWEALTGGTEQAASINILRGMAAGGEGAMPVNPLPLLPSARSFTDRTAIYNQDYWYQVQTVGADGTKTLSAEVHLKTDTAAPAGLTVTRGPVNNVLAWTNADGATGTLIEWSANGIGGWTQLTIAGSAVSSYTDTTRPRNGARFYRVRNLN